MVSDPALKSAESASVTDAEDTITLSGSFSVQESVPPAVIKLVRCRIEGQAGGVPALIRLAGSVTPAGSVTLVGSLTCPAARRDPPSPILGEPVSSVVSKKTMLSATSTGESDDAAFRADRGTGAFVGRPPETRCCW
jgi:hypothetical protein